MRSFLSVLVLLCAALVHAMSASGGDRVLILLDDVADKDTYSTFLGDLESRGFDLTYETPKSESLQLFTLKGRTYDHVVVFPIKSKGLGPSLTPNILVDFINADGNVILTTSSSMTTPSSIVALLAELEITLPAERTGVVADHFNYDTISSPEKHDTLTVTPSIPHRDDLASYFVPDTATDELIAVPGAVAQSLSDSRYLSPILRASRTAYSYDPKEQTEVMDPDDLFAAGHQISLVSAFKARNSARVAVVGSAEMLSNKWFEAKVKKIGATDKVKTWNREFAKRLSAWAFQEIGVLRVNSIDHHLNLPEGEFELNPKLYKVFNNVTYTISMSEWSWDKWVPFAVPENDALQLEFTMLNPYYRLDMNRTATLDDAAIYTAEFGLPDQHGIFNFMVNYKRPFLTNIEEKRTVSVRHRAHNEFVRSFNISGAWPWALGLWLTPAGFIAFCAVWMYSAPKEASKKAEDWEPQYDPAGLYPQYGPDEYLHECCDLCFEALLLNWALLKPLLREALKLAKLGLLRVDFEIREYFRRRAEENSDRAEAIANVHAEELLRQCDDESMSKSAKRRRHRAAGLHQRRSSCSVENKMD